MTPIRLFRDMEHAEKKENHPAFEKTINDGLNTAYNTAIDHAIAVAEADLAEALQYSASNTFASGHLKSLITKLKALKK